MLEGRSRRNDRQIDDGPGRSHNGPAALNIASTFVVVLGVVARRIHKKDFHKIGIGVAVRRVVLDNGHTLHARKVAGGSHKVNFLDGDVHCGRRPGHLHAFEASLMELVDKDVCEVTEKHLQSAAASGGTDSYLQSHPRKYQEQRFETCSNGFQSRCTNQHAR